MANTVIEGTITKIKNNGFTIKEQEGWLNVSKYANGDAHIPPVGTRVQLGVDGSGFVRTITPLETPAVQPLVQTAPEAPGQAIGSLADQKDLRITRLAVLNTATNIIAGSTGRANADEVIALAERLERWVLR